MLSFYPAIWFSLSLFFALQTIIVLRRVDSYWIHYLSALLSAIYLFLALYIK